MVRDKASRQPLQVFMVAASSSTRFGQGIYSIKNTIWWNHMGSYLIIDQSRNGCSKAYGILWTAWNMNLLHAKFICNHGTNELLIYSYNPFTSQAPRPWKRTTTRRGKNDYPWTVFVKAYQKTKKLCQELDFDKTRDLGGYAIRTSVKDVEGWFDLDLKKTGLDSFGGFSGVISKIIFEAMNATPETRVTDRTVPIGTITEDKKTYGQLLEVVDGKSDIILQPRSQLFALKLTTTIPVIKTDITAAIKHRSQMSELEKLMKVLDNSSKIGVVIVLFATLIFLKFLERQPLIKALLNMIRLVCNTSLLKLPTYEAPRIYLAFVFFFVVTLTGIYQGKLASLLTHSIRRPLINSHGKLADSDYTIYSNLNIENLIDVRALNGRFVRINTSDCVSHILKDSSAVCVHERSHLLALQKKKDFYVSTKNLAELSLVYVVREDWPLQDRVDQIILRLSEANLINYQFQKERNALSPVLKFYEKWNEKRKFKVLRLKNLKFAFEFLAIGLGFATVTFIVEVLLKLRNR